MNKITDILAGISQFLVQRNLTQNTPNNGVPPYASQQQPLGQTTPERVLPIDRNDNDQSQQINQAGHNAPFGVLPNASQKPIVWGQTTQTRVPPTCTTDPGEKGDETLSLGASNLFFQSNEIEVQKVVYIHVVQKKMTTILVLQAVHMMKTKNTGFSPQRNMMMSWKLDLKYRLL